MSLFDDDMFNDPDDLDEWFYFKLFPPYKDILGERISEKINETSIVGSLDSKMLFCLAIKPSTLTPATNACV